MERQISLLLVDDEERFLQTLARRLSMRDFTVTMATDGATALAEAQRREFDLALVDLKMPGMDGEQLLGELKRRYPDTEVVILTGHGSVESAVRATQLGSYHYLQKPCETEELLTVLQAAYARRVRRRLDLDEQRMTELMRTATGGSALAILRHLRSLDRSS